MKFKNTIIFYFCILVVVSIIGIFYQAIKLDDILNEILDNNKIDYFENNKIDYFDKFTNEEIVWVTVINEYYIDFTKNFLLSMKKNNVSFPFIVYCINMSEDKIKDLLTCGDDKLVVVKADPFLREEVTNGMTIYGSDDYKKIVFCKLDAIKYTMKQSRKYNIKNIGYIDTDITILKNPTDILKEALNTHPNIDVFSQCDEGEPKCSNLHDCPKICSGVIVFRNKQSLDDLFNYTNEDIAKYEGDQDFLLVELKRQKIKNMTIEKDIFQNGVIFYNIKTIPELITDRLYLVHYNWMPNFTKQDKMREYGMWYL